MTSNLELKIRQLWTSYETRSIVISIDEINDAWESYHKMVQYHLLTSELVNRYLQTPDLKERLADQSQVLLAVQLCHHQREYKVLVL